MKIIKKIILALSLLATLALNAKTEKMNVLFIMTDDQGYGDFSYTGNPYVRTPNVDKLASQSLDFTNYHAGSTCAPTRAGLMTSMYNNKMGIWHTIMGRSLLKPDQKTIANVFQENGYATGLFGKWHLGDNYPYRPFDRGFETTLWFKSGGVTQISDYWGNNYYNDTYLSGETPVKTEGYCTNVFFDYAMKFMKDSQAKDKPFFCYLSLNAPHGPYYVEEKYSKRFLTMLDKVPDADFYGMVENMDDNMGRLEAFLQKSGLDKNTIVIFTTDNGTTGGYYAAMTPAAIKTAKARAEKMGKTFPGGTEEKGWNGGMSGKKVSNLDGGHRVPFFMRIPNKAPVKISQLSANIDVAPTLYDILGIKEDMSKVDGVSLKAVVDDPSASIDRYLVVDAQREELMKKDKPYVVLKDNWRLLSGTALYDVTNDVAQKKNIIKDFPEVAKELEAVFEKYWEYIVVENEVTHPIYLAAPNEKSVVLTGHDKHISGAITHASIRSGAKTSPDGYWYVKVPEDGEYTFEIYRWAPEINVNLKDSSPAIPAIKGFNAPAQPEGVAIKDISGGEIIIGDIEKSLKISESENPLAIKIEKMKLKKGEYKLFANLFLSGSKKMGANYLKITKE
ncbi:MAG: arylsulfatase [Opitutales bacterium]